MKKYLIPAFVVLLGLMSCQPQVTISLKNELSVPRTDEVITFSRDQIEAKMEIGEQQLPAFMLDGKYVPSQIDDLDADGKWDEVAVLLNFAPNEQILLRLAAVAANDYPIFDKRTNLRLGIRQPDGSYKEVDRYRAIPPGEPFQVIAQAEGVTWENDKIGFRVYFDVRNVKDLFGKLKPVMVADKVHTPEFGSYHEMADWGMDILHCGSSLGAGGLALLRNDSLFRLGSTKVYEYRKITEGPVRSIFELYYEGWKVGDQELKAIERITLYPGKYWFKSDVTVEGLQDGDQIVTGIVTSTLKKEPFSFAGNGFVCMGTHDVQSLNNDELGMAVLVPEQEAGEIGRTSNTNFYQQGEHTVVEKKFSHSISETCYIGQKAKNGKPSTHYFFAVWGLENQRWKTLDGFKSYIEEEALKFSKPVLLQQ